MRLRAHVAMVGHKDGETDSVVAFRKVFGIPLVIDLSTVRPDSQDDPWHSFDGELRCVEPEFDAVMGLNMPCNRLRREHVRYHEEPEPHRTYDDPHPFRSEAGENIGVPVLLTVGWTPWETFKINWRERRRDRRKR